MSIVGVSGSQGQGKSTTIKGVVEKSDIVRYLDVQTARETLNDWGYSLAEVNAYMPLKIKFQDELYERHCDALNQVFGEDEREVFLVERTFADIFNYALVSVGPFNDYSEWLSGYFRKCMEAQEKYFNKVVLLSGRNYVPENDGVRSVNQHFSNLTNYVIHYYTRVFFMQRSEDVIIINDPDLDARVSQLLEICTNI